MYKREKVVLHSIKDVLIKYRGMVDDTELVNTIDQYLTDHFAVSDVKTAHKLKNNPEFFRDISLMSNVEVAAKWQCTSENVYYHRKRRNIPLHK